MDRIALISDIHGNLPALEATLRDIERRRIERIFCLGDLVGKGPHSEKVVDICQTVCERTIKGNWDDGLATTETDNPTPSGINGGSATSGWRISKTFRTPSNS